MLCCDNAVYHDVVKFRSQNYFFALGKDPIFAQNTCFGCQ